MNYQIRTYETPNGKRPFDIWLANLLDQKAVQAVHMRLNRLSRGDFGKCESVGQGVYELKMYAGPGYRVYFGKIGLHIILILCAGSKRTQKKDIQKAREYFEDYKKGGERHG